MEGVRFEVAEDAAVLEIGVTAAVGSGPTALAAFDACLQGAGVSNFNLVRLSSVIPPAALVAATPVELSARRWGAAPVDGVDRWGDRLFAVWAFESAVHPGDEAWAGVAWVQDPVDGRGLFVEHEGASEDQVRADLAASLSAISVPRGLEGCEQHSVVVGARCDGDPVGALVIAPYASERWCS